MQKTVLITGASRGIGANTARVFAAAGWKTAINYCNSYECAKLLKEDIISSGGTAEIYAADVSDTAQVDRMIADIYRELGHIDILINNAGLAYSGLLTETAEEIWDRIFAVNIKGMYNCSKKVIPNMVNRKKGKIINISSIWGIAGASCEVAYSASKSAVIGFTKALAKELGPSGIQVNCVAPGIIDTAMNAALNDSEMEWLKEETPLGRIGKPHEIAELLLFLASDKADFITGQVLSPNGGFVI